MLPLKHEDDGFSLIEALLAALLMASAVAGLAQLLGVGVRQSDLVRDESMAQSLAQSRLDALRALPWRYDAAGLRVSSPDLAMSPADALIANRPGYVDRLDRFGRVVADPADGTSTYVRRWFIAPFDADPDTLTLRACVWTIARKAGVANDIPDACVAGVRTRQP
jgi:hypothetical protein